MAHSQFTQSEDEAQRLIWQQAICAPLESALQHKKVLQQAKWCKETLENHGVKVIVAINSLNPVTT